ncbi:MAG TPA: sigma-70 family RNA polymerase sigma factor [Candidatus Eisenbacteria bacterium]|nr:sigma-70 family RNA polymerase sigma factor [Candidatus Eisenbacteria bacterium]
MGCTSSGADRGGTLGDGTALAGDDDGSEPKLRTTIFLLAQIRDGNQAARTKLWNRYFKPLGRLVRGHYIPHRVRALHDVDDIVMRVIEQVDPKLLDFEYRREGALMDYLRTVTRNLIISLSRVREPEREEMPTNIATDEPTPHERAVAMDQREAFEAALKILDERQRQAVILRFEYGFKYEEIAEEVDLASGNAARMMIQRAMLKMVEHMRGHRDFD